MIKNRVSGQVMPQQSPPESFTGESQTGDILTIALVKGEERYVVQYTAGTAAAAMRVLGGWAANKSLSFSWYDAAFLSQRIREQEKSQ